MKNTQEKNNQKDGHHRHSETCGCVKGKTAKNGTPNIEMEEPE